MRVGLTVVAVYVVVVAATLTFTGRRVLPLFEGIGPPPAYQWVHPPPELANGNVTPKPSTTDIAATAATTKAAAAFTADGQCVVNFSVGAFSPHDRDITVRATITPLDPAALGPLPPGSAADGNAYRIELTYQPSNTPVGALAVAGDVFLTIPHDATDLLYSADGRTWTTVPHTGVSSGSAVGATFSRPGWYLAVAPPTAPLGASQERVRRGGNRRPRRRARRGARRHAVRSAEHQTPDQATAFAMTR